MHTLEVFITYRLCDRESVNNPGEQLISQLSGARFLVVFQACFSSPDLLMLSVSQASSPRTRKSLLKP